MYCPNCGAYNEASYNNCTSCGTYIKDINKTTVEPGENQEPCYHGSEKVFEKSDKTGDFFSDYEKQGKEKEEKRKEESAFYGSNAERGEKRDGQFYTVYTKPPKDYLVWSIICTILAGMSFGLAAIVFSVMTKVSYSSGNINSAIQYSNNAKRFCIISAVVGIVKYIFIFVMFGFVFNTMFRYPLYMW